MKSIINKPIDTSVGTVEDWDRAARERSDRLYDLLQQQIIAFDPFAPIQPGTFDTSPLTSTEKFFLEKIHGQKVGSPYVPGYWYYEYNIIYKQLMQRLIGNEYLKLSEALDDIFFMKVDELKAILRKANLPVSGKKAELLARINENVTPENLNAHIDSAETRFMMTSKGKDAVQGLEASMTKNLEMEDQSMAYILSHQLDEAYAVVCDFEANKNAPRGMGIDWEKEKNGGLCKAKIELYSEFMNSSLEGLFDPEYLCFDPQIKASVILGIMLGTTADKMLTLLVRFTGVTTRRPSDLIQPMQRVTFALMEGHLHF